MKLLPTLKSGDVVDIIAPAFGCSGADVSLAVDFLHSWGLKARVAEGLLGTDLLCANADSRRAETLYNALTNDESKAVWAIRGGYGSARLLHFLESGNNHPPSNPPKLFLGFSDITMLHIWLRQRWGWPTLHAPTLLRAARGEVTAESLSLLRKFLFGEIKQLSYGLTKLNKAADIAEIIEAEITGGNLAIIASGTGTDWQIYAAGKILFFEEVDERGYKIDRMLTHLQQAGVINTPQPPKAIIFGDFNGGDEADGSSLVLPVIKRFAESAAIPCFGLSGIGHGEVNNPLPFGINARIKAEKLMLSR